MTDTVDRWWSHVPKTPLVGWDARWSELAGVISGWSEDRSRGTSALIIGAHDRLVSIGWNGLPRGVSQTDARLERPGKYKWTVHAEANAIHNAAALGVPTLGCTMVLPWFPCAPCAAAIVQAGIIEVVCVEPDWGDERWADDFAIVREMFAELAGKGRLSVRFVDGEPKVSQ